MSTIEGKISIGELPPHFGLTVDLCFYAVGGPDASAPFNGEPPADTASATHKAFDDVHLNKESTQTSVELPFTLEQSLGFYYLEIRSVLYRKESGKVFAQAEQFFFGRRPIQVVEEDIVGLELPVTWPSMKIEDLGHYGTVHPTNARPWWKLW